MPVTGAMFPHGSDDASTGFPRWAFHTTAPVKRSSEYTVLFSVATSTCPATIRGDAYTSPSTATSHARCGRPNAGEAAPKPAREESPWYSTQSPEMRGDGLDVAAEVGDVVGAAPKPHANDVRATDSVTTEASRPFTAPS